MTCSCNCNCEVTAQGHSGQDICKTDGFDLTGGTGKDDLKRMSKMGQTWINSKGFKSGDMLQLSFKMVFSHEDLAYNDSGLSSEPKSFHSWRALLFLN